MKQRNMKYFNDLTDFAFLSKKQFDDEIKARLAEQMYSREVLGSQLIIKNKLGETVATAVNDNFCFYNEDGSTIRYMHMNPIKWISALS